MATIHVSVERVVHAPPKRVFSLLYDYEMGHWHVLPKAFSNYRVLKPGPGGRTRIGYTLTVAGTRREVEAEISVPKRDRAIVETDLERGTLKTYAIDPIGPDSRLRIETSWETPDGIVGALERRLVPRILRSLFEQELNLIAFWAPNWYELPPEIAAAARQLDGEVYLLIPPRRERRSRRRRTGDR